MKVKQLTIEIVETILFLFSDS